jgi:hypothetical protein
MPAVANAAKLGGVCHARQQSGDTSSRKLPRWLVKVLEGDGTPGLIFVVHDPSFTT